MAAPLPYWQDAAELLTRRRTCGGSPGKREGHSDSHSRGLSHHSTGTDADGLDFRVRDGTG